MVEGLKHGVSDLHEYADLFVEVGELLRHQWIVEFRVISREDNVVADFLARNSFNYGLGIHVVFKADAVHLLKDVGCSWFLVFFSLIFFYIKKRTGIRLEIIIDYMYYLTSS